MIKNRTFLLGLGSGLIAGALLLQLMISGNAAPLTQAQVLKGAAHLNLKVTDAAGKPLTGGEPDTGTLPGAEHGQQNSPGEPAASPAGSPGPSGGAASPPPSAPAAAVTPSPAAPPKAAESDAAVKPSPPAVPSAPAGGTAQKPVPTVTPAVPDKPEAPQKPSEPPAAVPVTVRIPNGVTLNGTADLLAKAGVVKDKNAFLKSAKERKINTKIQSGTFSFEKGEDIDTVIQKLITVKK